MKTILLCIDFSDYTAAVINKGIEIAQAFDSELCLMHVTRPIIGVGDVDTTTESVRLNVAEHFKEEHEKLQALSADVRDKGISARAVMVEGAPIASLVKQEAEKIGADLIIIGTKGHGRIAGLCLGSVSQKLLESVSTPVLVVQN